MTSPDPKDDATSNQYDIHMGTGKGNAIGPNAHVINYNYMHPQPQMHLEKDYFSKMDQLRVSLKKNLFGRRNQSAVAAAQALTTSILPNLDKAQKGLVIRYLYEYGLIKEGEHIISLVRADLSGASLGKIDLSGARLFGVDLTGAYLIKTNLKLANLAGAKLRRADLREADLRGANLRGAGLHGANLGEADLSGADLSTADLSSANLTETFLIGANLTDAFLSGADLTDAFLSGADLTDANLRDCLISANQLAVASSLKGTIYDKK